MFVPLWLTIVLILVTAVLTFYATAWAIDAVLNDAIKKGSLKKDGVYYTIKAHAWDDL